MLFLQVLFISSLFLYEGLCLGADSSFVWKASTWFMDTTAKKMLNKTCNQIQEGYRLQDSSVSCCPEMDSDTEDTISACCVC